MGFADKDTSGQAQEVIGFGGQGTFDANAISPFRLVRDAYTGFGGFRDGSYLVRHKREMEFETRRGYSYYVNLFAPILDSLVDPVFERAPMRAGGGNLWPEFLADCDRTGRSLTDFMKLAAFKSKRDGSAWIVIDNVAAPAGTLEGAAVARAFPYLYLKEASEVVYWKTGKCGALEEIAFSETVGSTEMGKTPAVQYRKWTPMTWEVFAKYEEGELKEPIPALSGSHGLGQIPVVPVYSNFLENNSPLPHPPLYQIAVLNTAIYNLSSEIRSLQRSQGFSILVIPALNGKFPAGFTIGASNALAVPDTSKFLPQFVSPDVSVLQPYFDERKFLIESIYRQAKLAGVTGVVETSGVSKSWDFRATNVALAQLARAVEGAERQLCALFGLWQGDASWVLTVSYPEDFGVVDLDGEIKQAADFLALGFPPRVNLAVKARVLSYYFQALSPEEIEELADAVEQACDDELQSDIDRAEAAQEARLAAENLAAGSAGAAE